MTRRPRPVVRRGWLHRHPGLALVAVNLVSLLVGSLVLEGLYRHQTFDFYATELRAFNPHLRQQGKQSSTILALGDSFTAGLDSYPHWLRERLGPGWEVVNGGVPGVTVLQAALVAGRRVAQTSPRVVIYQTYVGNDLLDLQHPVSWRRVNPLRNLYWIAQDLGWGSLGFLNYRLGQIGNRVRFSLFWKSRVTDLDAISEGADQTFSVTRYRRRERLLLAADPWIIDQQIELGRTMERAWQRYSSSLGQLIARCRREGAAVIIVVVPHCVQVDQRYRDRFALLGARFQRSAALTASGYPFATRLRETVAGDPRVVVIDPLEALRNAERGGHAMYRDNDDHLTVAGQQVLAWLLADEVRALVGSTGESAHDDGR